MSEIRIPNQCLAGVHWYNPGGTSIVDTSAPELGVYRGWNVEIVYGLDNTTSLNVALKYAKKAKDVGLVNIIRLDYESVFATDQAGNLLKDENGNKILTTRPVPKYTEGKNGIVNDPDYQARITAWKTKFWNCVTAFTQYGDPPEVLADIFIVGNEPTVEPHLIGIMADEYANAFNALYASKPSNVKLLAAGPAAFSGNPGETVSTKLTFLDWLEAMSFKLTDVDGFALHSYGNPIEHGNPETAYTLSAGYDGGFYGFREQIDRIALKWGCKFPSKPVYITEFNTDTNGLKEYPNPQDNYPQFWINKAFNAVREYNSRRPATAPPVMCLCWFVDRIDGEPQVGSNLEANQTWKSFALSNRDETPGKLIIARNEMQEEFKRRENFNPIIPFASFAFEKQWARSDKFVALNSGDTQVTWVWGPRPLTLGIYERYDGSPNNKRLVQYFDKARMELNNPNAPNQVTNGHLVKEMIVGQLQTSAGPLEGTPNPAAISCAGDPGGGAPTYAALGKVAYPLIQTGATENRSASTHPKNVISEIIKTDGTMDNDATEIAKVQAYQIRIAEFASFDRGGGVMIGFNVPQVFKEFFEKKGTVYDYGVGGFVNNQPILNRMSTVGLPLSEPYWSKMKVAGVEGYVLIQAYERHILTYNPDPSPKMEPRWRTQLSNAGAHYYQWRYGESAYKNNSGYITTQNVPASAQPGQNFNVKLTLMNNGTTGWASAGSSRSASFSEALGEDSLSSVKGEAKQPDGLDTTAHRAFSQQAAGSGSRPRLEVVGSSLPWSVTSLELPHPVSPGAVVNFDFNLTAPNAPGQYTLQLRMAQDGVAWTGKYCTEILKISVGVAPDITGPTNLYAYVRSPTEILFSWNRAPWARKYSFEIARSESDLMGKVGSSIRFETPNDFNEVPYTGLTPGTTYYWRVFAYRDSQGAYGYPEPRSVTTPRPVDYHGSLDAVNCAMIAGWAWDSGQPNTPIYLDVYADGVRIDTIVADSFRPDLPGAGIGNGYHAFGYTPPDRLFDGQPHIIKVTVAGKPQFAFTNPTPLQGRLATYSGKVSCQSGGDGGGAQVILLVNNVPWRSTNADPNGSFSFSNIRAGSGLSYALKASKPWHTTAPAVPIPAGINNQTVNMALTHQTFAINGLLSTSDFGGSLPVPDITVKLLGAAGQQTVQTGSQASDKGLYKFGGVLAGLAYTVQPLHLYYRISPQTSSIPLLGSNLEVNFQASRITRKLTVQVVDDATSAQPMSGVTVTLSRKDGVEPPKEGVTGTDGKFTFEGLKTGRDYTVSFAKQYYRFFPQRLDTPANVGTADDLLDLTLGSVGQRIKHTISGKIMAEAFLRNPANPVPGAQLNMLLNGVRSTIAYQTMEDGTFTMSQPEGWGYTIEPSHDYFTFEPPILMLGALLQDLSNQNFVAKRKKFLVSGSVKDAGGRPVRDVTVKATWKSSDPNIGSTSTSQTNTGGNYSMTEMLAGVYYSLEVLTPANSTGFHVEPYILYTEPVLNAPKQNVNFIAGYEINGRLTDIRGNPISGVKLTVTDTMNAGSALTTQTDAQGNYQLKHLAPGFFYTVTPTKDGMQFDRQSQTVSNLSGSVRVDFVGGHHISGHIEDNFTTPRLALPGVKVVLQCTPALPPQFIETEQITDEHGMYHFATLFPPGCTCTATPSKQGITFDPPSRSKSNLNYNEPFGFFGGYSISGKVTAINGKPMNGVEVTLSRSRADGPPLQIKIITNAAGEYTFKSLAVGKYTLMATSAGTGFLPAALAIDNLNGDQVQDFKQVFTISGKLTFGQTHIALPGIEVQLMISPASGAGKVKGRLAPPLSTRTDVNGRYNFNIESLDATYTITPTSDKHIFAPPSRTLNGLQAAQVVDFATATPPADDKNPAPL